MSGLEGQQAVAAYLASKGLPMTGENIRRALEQNAANPGLIKGLVNQAPPPPDAQGGAAPTSNARGSAAAGLSQRMHQAAPQQQPQSQQPVAMSDSAMSQPTQPPQPSGGGGGLLASIAQMILGGGAGAGLAHLFMGGRGGATQPPPIGELGIPIPGGNLQLGNGPVALPAPQAALPPPAQVGGPAQLSGPPSPVAGVNPIGPPQPGRLEPGPSSSIPPQSDPIAMPRNTGQSMVMQGAPTSTTMTGGRVPASPVELPQGIDWGKILGDLTHVVRR